MVRFVVAAVAEAAAAAISRVRMTARRMRLCVRQTVVEADHKHTAKHIRCNAHQHTWAKSEGESEKKSLAYRFRV